MVIITVLHIFVCFALILIVLLQAGKGAEMGAAFGGASQTIFGSAGAMGFLTKVNDDRCRRLYDHLASSGLHLIQTSVFGDKGGRHRRFLQRPQPVPVQPQVPAPEPKEEWKGYEQDF